MIYIKGAEVVPVVEKPGVAMSTVWPGLNSNDKGRQKKDIELRCLMSEIDDLMVDVGLTGGKRKKNTITYEQVGSKIPQYYLTFRLL